MCLLKVYIEDAKTGDRSLVAENVALISAENKQFRLLDVEAGENVLTNVDFFILDALNSTLVFKVKG
jgi:hypothetical protein